MQKLLMVNNPHILLLIFRIVKDWWNFKIFLKKAATSNCYKIKTLSGSLNNHANNKTQHKYVPLFDESNLTTG